jgi:sugar lactone lactonase YvrE
MMMANDRSTLSNIRCIVRSRDICGEGAMWHPPHRAIYWTDINRGLVHRHRLAAHGEFDTWVFDQSATALALTTQADEILVVLGGEVLLWNPNTDRRGMALYRLPQWPELRCNDARVDPAGALWFGTMQNNVAADTSTLPVTNHVGTLNSFKRSSVSQSWSGGFGIQNTIAWTPDGKTMLFGDTSRNEIYACDYERSTASIANKRLFTSGFARGLPDGSAMNAKGFLWNCRYGGACIVRFAPDGSVDRIVDTPVPNPTTCVFGGVDFSTLYFTSAGEGCQVAGPDDGGLFCFEPGVHGLAATPFDLTA